MSTELIINASLPETRIALMENGEIQELLIERASDKGIVGNIYKGRVTRVLPGMQAAFVDIGLEKAAFLYVDDVYVHNEIFEEEEGAPAESVEGQIAAANGESTEGQASVSVEGSAEGQTNSEENLESAQSGEEPAETPSQEQEFESQDLADDEEDGEEDGEEPVSMGPAGGEGDDDQPSGTVAPPASRQESSSQESSSDDQTSFASTSGSRESSSGGSVEDDIGNRSPEGGAAAGGEGASQERGGRGGPRRHRRGRRGGKHRTRRGGQEFRGRGPGQGQGAQAQGNEAYPENYQEQIHDEGSVDSDRSSLSEGSLQEGGMTAEAGGDRPVQSASTGDEGSSRMSVDTSGGQRRRPEFRQQRGRDRRIRAKVSSRMQRPQVNIQDLLQEGQEVLVQVAKDPIATKGARLTCHISLPGRHLVCMPTIDHVGVSRRIERDDERRRLRDFVERNRPRNLGFIVRTASGRTQSSERRIKQDIDYLTRLWDEIREKAGSVTAPALVYEDLNSILRAIRDWVTEDIDKIIVDSRYHFNEIQKFASHFMPSLRSKVDLYHGDIPIFDAYSISSELSRSLERKVWLKSGGYIVIDQAEALVAVDVNTGRYVGKKNLEDTILKTNLEAVQEIAYQLRLRNCGGIIILDLIDMEKEENRHRVYRALEDALKKDRARPTIQKISDLGLIEMTRKRTRDTMVRTLCESCSHCEGKGFVKSKQTVAYEVLREVERAGIERDITKILVQAHSDVIDILAIDERETLDQLERRYRKSVYLQAVGDFHPEQFEVVNEKKDRSQTDQRSGSRHSSHGRDRDDHPGHGGGGGRHRQKYQEARVIPNPMPGEAPQVHAHANPADVAMATTEGHESAQAQLGIQSGDATMDMPNQAGGSEENTGNRLGIVGASSSGNSSRPSTGHGPGDGFENEEDRLAFLRAQAAQDAALASLTAGGNARQSQGHGRAGSGGGGKWSNNRGGGGGGGRRGGRNNNNSRRGGRGGHRNGPRHAGGYGANAGGYGANAGQNSAPYRGEGQGSNAEFKQESTNTSTEDKSRDSGGGSGDNQGGGGDHSQPPV